MLMRAVSIAAALFCLGIQPALAVPKQIIILRHGEKANSTALCSVGIQRSQALAAQYLGKGAANSLFSGTDTPAAFIAITLHTLELIAPTAATWGLPVTTWSVVPLPGADEEKQLDAQTRLAANDVLTNPAYDGKIVVMTWEHKHIANKTLQDKHPNGVTLRQLLNLGVLTGTNHVHETWQGSNYDYFWIVDYGNAGSSTPTAFKHVRQEFTGAFKSVPSNHWGKPEKLPPNSGCKS